MANSFTSTFVNLPIEKLYEELLLPTDSLDKGVAQILPGYQKQVALNRFFADGSLEVRTPKFGTGTLGDFVKDEKQILMTEVQQNFEIDIAEFNIDHRFLWTSGPSAMKTPSPELERAIFSTVGRRFRNNLNSLLWNGGLGTITGWVADIDAADARGNAIAAPVTGPITDANVQASLKAVKDLMPPEVRNKQGTRPVFVTTYAVLESYKNSLTEQDFKDNNTADAPRTTYQGYEVVAVDGVPANFIYMLTPGPNDDAELKAAVWMDSDRFNVQMGKGHDLDDVWGVRISMSIGTGSLLNKQIVVSKPV